MLRGRWFACAFKNIPSVPGCYAIFTGRLLLYIGSSTNLRDRLTNHNRNLGFPAHCEIRVRPARRAGDWLMVEYRLIGRLQPPLNNHYKSNRVTMLGKRARSCRVSQRQWM